MNNLEKNKKKKYLLEGRGIFNALFWCLLIVGAFFSILFLVTETWEMLKGTVLWIDLPCVLCYFISHERFFWSQGRQEQYIQKCIAAEKRAVSPNTPVEPVQLKQQTTPNTAASQVKKNASVEDTVVKLATYYAIGKAAQKAAKAAGVGLFPNNKGSAAKRNLTFPGQGNRCRDCAYAVPRDRNQMTCHLRNIPQTVNANTVTHCPRWTPK